MRKYLIASILGLLVLFVISGNLQTKEVESCQELRLGESVKTSGKIVSIRTYEDFSIIKLDNNLSVTCNCLYKNNQSITVYGRVTSYNNQLQIQAEKITQ